MLVQFQFQFVYQPPFNGAGQFFALGSPYGPVCRGSQKDYKEGLLVDWPKDSGSCSFGSLFSSKTLQLYGSTNGIRHEGQCRIPAILCAGIVPKWHAPDHTKIEELFLY